MEKVLKISKKDTNIFVKGIVIYAITIFLYILIYRLGLNDYVYDYTTSYRNIFKIIAAVIIAFTLLFLLFAKSSKKIEDDDFYGLFLKAIIFLGIVLRITVTLCSDCRNCTYDMGSTELDVEKEEFAFVFNPYGHGGYVAALFNGHLPYTNTYQFYQQPFFYILGAITSRFINLFTSGIYNTEDFFIVDPAKIVSCLAGCLTIYVAKSFLEHFELSKRAKILALSFFAFYPGLIMLSSRVSVDALTMFFMALTLLFTTKWYEEPSWKNTIILALSYGFAAMTKISGVLFAPLTVAVVIYSVVKKHLLFKDVLKKTLIFSLISLPLGLWYNVRNFIKFDQPFGYVYPQNETMGTYAGDHSLAERFLPSSEWFSDIVVDLHENSNFYAFFFKTSLYGPLALDNLLSALAGFILFAFAVVTAIWLTCSIASSFFINRSYNVMICSTLVICCYLIALIFYVKEPYTCSMDFRYMAIIVLPLSILAGNGYDNIKNKGVRDFSELLFGFFSVFSTAFYLIADI